ncbi:hypothetical protein HRbin12_01265 [bacterium HR12]|nr:hypothetical protein HRbin12_01265 [bacterium HR12]
MVGDPARVDDGARRADGGVADRPGQAVEEREVRGILHPPPAGDYDPGLLELGPARRLGVPFDAPGDGDVGRQRGPDRHHLGPAAGGLGGDDLGPHEHEARLGALQGDLHDLRVAEDLGDGPVQGRHVRGVGEERGAERRLEASGHVPSLLRGGEEDQGGVVLGDEPGEGVRGGLADHLREGRIVPRVHGGRAVATEGLGRRGRPRPERDRRDLAGERARLREQLERRGQRPLGPELRVDPHRTHLRSPSPRRGGRRSGRPPRPRPARSLPGPSRGRG